MVETLAKMQLYFHKNLFEYIYGGDVELSNLRRPAGWLASKVVETILTLWTLVMHGMVVKCANNLRGEADEVCIKILSMQGGHLLPENSSQETDQASTFGWVAI